MINDDIPANAHHPTSIFRGHHAKQIVKQINSSEMPDRQRQKGSFSNFALNKRQAKHISNFDSLTAHTIKLPSTDEQNLAMCMLANLLKT